ncbi:MAG: Ribosomal silencing factor RsfS [Chlamydiae bacterium]|nr:Ribosomal silencing factor RsfS [Chlamydiota bacterium]
MAVLGHKPVKVEGEQEGHWVILDYLNVMVHILTPTFREKYRLERLWDEGTIIDLNLESE